MWSNLCEFWEDAKRQLVSKPVRCRTHYRIVFSGKYEAIADIIVDSQDKDEVYYLFSVYLDDPDVKIYVCYSDGTQKRIRLGKAGRYK